MATNKANENKTTIEEKSKKIANESNNTLARYHSDIANGEIREYIKQLEVQKQRREYLDQKLKEENGKVEILSKNIGKLDKFNKDIDKEVLSVRKESSSLESEIIELKLSLEKAEAESKMSRVKQIKRDILANAKILKDQENHIKQLREQREEIRLQQKKQRDLLLEKREQIESISKNTLENEFNDVNEELVDLMHSTLANNSDKTQIISAALQEASAEMNRIKEADGAMNARHDDKIELLRTQMINLNTIQNGGGSASEVIANKEARWNDESSRFAPRTSDDIESEVQLVNKLDKLVRQGLISESDKQRELEEFSQRSAASRMVQQQPMPVASQPIEEQKKMKAWIKWFIALTVLLLAGAIAVIALLLTGIIG